MAAIEARQDWAVLNLVACEDDVWLVPTRATNAPHII